MKLGKGQFNRLVCFALHFWKYEVLTVSFDEWQRGTVRYNCPTCKLVRVLQGPEE